MKHLLALRWLNPRADIKLRQSRETGEATVTYTLRESLPCAACNVPSAVSSRTNARRRTCQRRLQLMAQLGALRWRLMRHRRA